MAAERVQAELFIDHPALEPVIYITGVVKYPCLYLENWFKFICYTALYNLIV